MLSSKDLGIDTSGIRQLRLHGWEWMTRQKTCISIFSMPNTQGEGKPYFVPKKKGLNVMLLL